MVLLLSSGDIVAGKLWRSCCGCSCKLPVMVGGWAMRTGCGVSVDFGVSVEYGRTIVCLRPQAMQGQGVERGP